MSGPGTSQVFDFTGTIEAYIVPATGTYEINAFGAQGGSQTVFQPLPFQAGSQPGPTHGGFGGEAEGSFYLLQGQTLEVAVGSTGVSGDLLSGGRPFASPPSGGGGGSFVAISASTALTPLVVAGGGAGTAWVVDGPATPSGGAGGAGSAGTGQGSSIVGGGAGFFGNGAGTASTTVSVDVATIDTETSPGGAEDFENGLLGGSGATLFEDQPAGTLILQSLSGNGGFGGGGGGNFDGSGGGGGGYTGGDPGQGGTSFVSPMATDVVLNTGVETGNGEVIITELSCFAAGTRLATPSGPRAVETLKAGDVVLSHLRSTPVPVLWVGNRRVDCVLHPHPAKVLPVCIRAGAFGRGRPVRSLLLSPDHAVFVEGILIPVWALVNGTNVRRKTVREVTYWHVEVDRHDVLLAEGLPVESFLDTGGRAAFIDSPVTALVPDFAARVWEAEGCAPLRVTGPEVNAVRARLTRSMDTQRAERSA